MRGVTKPVSFELQVSTRFPMAGIIPQEPKSYEETHVRTMEAPSSSSVSDGSWLGGGIDA